MIFPKILKLNSPLWWYSVPWTVSSREDVTGCQFLYHLSPLSKGYGQISEKNWIPLQLKLVLEKSLNVFIVFLQFLLLFLRIWSDYLELFESPSTMRALGQFGESKIFICRQLSPPGKGRDPSYKDITSLNQRQGRFEPV